MFAVSCPSLTTCEALGTAQLNAQPTLQEFVVTYVNGVPTTTVTLPLTEIYSAAVTYVGSISCPSVGNCVAYFEGQGYGQSYVVETNGTWGSPKSLPPSERLQKIDCVTVSWCVGVGSDASASNAADAGLVAIYSGGAWAAQTDVANTTWLRGVSCWGIGSCEAVGDVEPSGPSSAAEAAVQLKGGVLQPAVKVPPPESNSSQDNGGLYAVSCLGTGECLAAGNFYNGLEADPISVEFTAGSWQTSSFVSLPSDAERDFAGFDSVDCVDASDCTLGGGYVTTTRQGAAMMATGSLGSGTQSTTELTAPSGAPDDLTGVGCYNANTCVLIGNYTINLNTSDVTTLAASVTAGNVPGAPLRVEALAGNGILDVKWTAPADDGGSPITYYTVKAGSAGCSTTVATSCTVSNLTNGKAYEVTVTANNTFGAGNSSSAVTGVPTTTPKGPPGEVRDLDAQPGSHEVTLTWLAPRHKGTGIAHYSVCHGATSPVCSSTSKLKDKVTGLKNGVKLKFTVVVVGKDGELSKPSSVSARPT
jgi:hypothetical protein